MRFIPASLSLPLSLSLFMGLGCERAGSSETVTPAEPESAPAQEYVPEPTSDWGSGTVTGLARLKWGAPPPEGATMRLTFWRNGEMVEHHMVPVSGPGPWAFEFQPANVDSFVPEDSFGLGAMIEVPPDGEAWYMGDPPSIQIWKYGGDGGAIEVDLLPIDPRAAGDGPPSE